MMMSRRCPPSRVPTTDTVANISSASHACRACGLISAGSPWPAAHGIDARAPPSRLAAAASLGPQPLRVTSGLHFSLPPPPLGCGCVGLGRRPMDGGGGRAPPPPPPSPAAAASSLWSWLLPPVAASAALTTAVVLLARCPPLQRALLYGHVARFPRWLVDHTDLRAAGLSTVGRNVTCVTPDGAVLRGCGRMGDSRGALRAREAARLSRCNSPKGKQSAHQGAVVRGK